MLSPSLALFFAVLRSIGEEGPHVEVHHLASSVGLDLFDDRAPVSESSVFYPERVVIDWDVFISENVGIALVVGEDALQATEEVNRLVELPPVPVSEVPVQVLVEFVIEVVLLKKALHHPV